MRIINTNFAIARDSKLNELADMIINICDPHGADFFEQNNAHRFLFHDVAKPAEGITLPQLNDLQKLEFLANRAVERELDNVLITCTGGVSRSAAATLLFFMVLFEGDWRTAIDQLFKVNPEASPNEFMLEWIDNHWDCGGQLIIEANNRWIAQKLSQDPEFFD